MKDLFSVRDKVVVVTGGSRGIGDDRRRLSGQRCQGLYQFPEGEACDATAERLAQEYGGICRSIPANLATLEGIDSFCARFRGAGRPSRRAHQQRRRCLGRAP